MIYRLMACAAALLLACSATGAAEPPTRPPTAEELAAAPFISDAALSPDGHRIAAVVSNGDANAIAIYDADGDASQTPRLVQSNGYTFLDVDWAGDSRLLIKATSVARFQGTGLRVPVIRVLLDDLDAHQDRILGPNGGLFDEVIHLDPARRFLLLSSQTGALDWPGVYRVDLATGDSTLVERPRDGITQWFADRTGTVRAGTEDRDGRTRILYRASADAPWHRYPFGRADDEDVIVEKALFLASGENGLVLTNGPTGRFAVFEYDFASGQTGREVFEAPEADVTDLVTDENGTLLGVRYEDATPHIRWLDPARASLQREIDATFPNRINVLAGRSRDGNRLLIHSSSPDDPGTYYVFDRVSRRMKIFASPYGRLVERQLAPMQVVSYRARGGETLRGYLTLPVGAAPQRLPLVLLPHGGPFERDHWTFDPEVQFLAAQGYAVFQPQFRGSTGAGRAEVERGIGQFGSGMIDDMEDGVDWLASAGTIDPARVCVMGSSYGGYAALWMPIRKPERYRCAIAFAAPTDMETMMRHDRSLFSAPRYFRRFRDLIRGDPPVDLGTISPLQHAERMHVPVLIAHGELDSRVPIDQARRMEQALRRNGATVEAVYYPQAGHGFQRSRDLNDYFEHVAAFLSRYNPARTNAPQVAATANGQSRLPISTPTR